MKNIIIAITLLVSTFSTAQAYKGEGDGKFQVGADFQNNATGVQVTYDYGVGENISIGLSTGYATNINKDAIPSANFDERFLLRGRFNANLGSVLKLDPAMDLYPGLNIGTKNFGGHLGFRYFFTEGFGVYTEANVPLAKFKSEALTPAEELYNQFTLSLGASFNF